MHTVTSLDENKYFHRQGNMTLHSNENDQLSPRIHSIMDQSYEYSQLSNHDNTQSFNVDEEYQYSETYPTTDFNLQTISNNYNEDYNYHHINTNDNIQNWEQLLDKPSQIDHSYQDISQLDLITNKNINLDIQKNDDIYQYNKNLSFEEINSDMDYETIIRTKHLYNDPNPQIIRKPSMITPVVYNQKVIVRFLQPPPVQQGPIIIREIRPPQPPPLSPIIIRQKAQPPRSPSPIILREKPPPKPDSTTPQVVIKTLSPLPPPPRPVILEKIPPLPPKPRDVIIERWIPYENIQKRKVIVQRAEEPKPYPPPKNIIIVYEPVQTRIIRNVERLGIKPEDPHNYLTTYRDSLLQTEQLLERIKQLGITEDLSPPQHIFTNEQQQTSLDIDEQNYNYNTSLQQQQQQHHQIYNEINDNYVPPYENLVNGSLSKINYDEKPERQIDHNNPFYLTSRNDLSTHFTQYGLTTESIPF
ncbi:unnamed protein product [Rotaria sordida]|uniref:Uncharacterized protein n=1 Tax=Rotaria sordida TaxID=392033 RepID=A0A819CXE3_9BILA|nr:unnamed protein product [Rotaria sordida]CAF3826921.1 unnamed protein product [Rotaria sordida]